MTNNKGAENSNGSSKHFKQQQQQNVFYFVVVVNVALFILVRIKWKKDEVEGKRDREKKA